MKEIWHYPNLACERQGVPKKSYWALGSRRPSNPKSQERPDVVSPTIFRELGFRFFFYSREESRMHVHVHCAHGDAKFWLEPSIELVENYGLRSRDISKALKLVEEHIDEIRDGWQNHFRS